MSFTFSIFSKEVGRFYHVHDDGVALGQLLLEAGYCRLMLSNFTLNNNELWNRSSSCMVGPLFSNKEIN